MNSKYQIYPIPDDVVSKMVKQLPPAQEREYWSVAIPLFGEVYHGFYTKEQAKKEADHLVAFLK